MTWAAGEFGIGTFLWRDAHAARAVTWAASEAVTQVESLIGTFWRGGHVAKTIFGGSLDSSMRGAGADCSSVAAFMLVFILYYYYLLYPQKLSIPKNN